VTRTALLAFALAVAAPAAAQAPGQRPGDVVQQLTRPETPSTTQGPRETLDEIVERLMTPELPARPTRATTPREVAVLRGLDTFSGQVGSFPVAVGATGRFERMEVRVLACHEVEGDDGYAFVEIVDLKAPGTIVFRGWMVASSPALSGLDHPRYDIWLAACSTASG
jgi:hypothetical protein